jgi:hypothetical protein
MGTYVTWLPSRLPVGTHATLVNVAIQRIDIERTFNFAINVLSVCKNSLAVLCDVLCWSSFLLTAEKSL